jgi:hypothetical protein
MIDKDKNILLIGTPYHLPNGQVDDVTVPFDQVEYFKNFGTNFADVIPDIKSGKTKLVFLFSDAWNTCNEYETNLTLNGNFLTIDLYNILYNVVTELGIKENSVFTTPSSVTGLKQHSDWPAHYYLESFNRYFEFNFGYQPSPGPHKYNYLWLNRRSRQHRVYGLHEAFRLGMMKDALYTFHNFNETKTTEEQVTHILAQYLPTEQINLDFLNHTRAGLNDTYDVNKDLQDVEQIKNLKSHAKNCRLEIISEFNCSNNKPFLTEKISRSIVMGKPFIVLGDRNSLSELRRLGFKTFSSQFDETYDELPDIKSRIDSALASARSYNSETYNDKMQEILEHNYNHYFGAYRDQQLALFKQVIIK